MQVQAPSLASASAITREFKRLRSRVQVKLLASEVVTTNQFIDRVIALIYSSSKANALV